MKLSRKCNILLLLPFKHLFTYWFIDSDVFVKTLLLYFFIQFESEPFILKSISIRMKCCEMCVYDIKYSILNCTIHIHLQLNTYWRRGKKIAQKIRCDDGRIVTEFTQFVFIFHIGCCKIYKKWRAKWDKPNKINQTSFSCNKPNQCAHVLCLWDQHFNRFEQKKH